MRIHKLLSSEGVLSRRTAESYIAAGRVTVNGRKAVIGQDVNPAKDIVAVDNVRVEFDKKRRRYYIALYKPRGYVATLADERGRRTVTELVEGLDARVYPIGRLDMNSEGLILLTNDGDFANLIMHPSNEVNKCYRTTIAGSVTEDQLVKLATGVMIEDGLTAPAQVDVIDRGPGRTVLRITIHEGRNRQIRRMCEAVGLEVSRLKRISIGPVQLGMLQPGKWRELTPAEVGALRMAVKKTNRASIEAENKQANAKKPRRPAQKPGAKPAGRPTGNSSGRPTGRPTGKPAGRPAGNSAGRPAGNSSGKPTGNSSGKPTGNSSGRPAGNSSGRPTGNSSGRPAGKPTGRPTGKPAGSKQTGSGGK